MPVRVVAKQALRKGREAVANVDLWRATDQRLAVQVGEDQARLRAKGQAQPNPITRLRVDSFATNHLQLNAAVSTFPLPALRPRIAVGEAGLTEDSVLVEDRGRVLRSIESADRRSRRFTEL